MAIRIPPNLESLLRDLQSYATQNADIDRDDRGFWLRFGEAVSRSEIADLLRRDELNDELLAGLRNPTDPPAVGEFVLFGMVAEFLNLIRKATLRRGMSRIRATSLAAARLREHGRSDGVWIRNVLDAMRDVVARTEQR